jgi:hypothetical protein
MPRYLLKTDGVEYEVSKPAVPKVDEKGIQKIDPYTHLPVWSVQLTSWTDEDHGADVLLVSVASVDRPALRWREPVIVEDLEMIPWAQKRRDGEMRQGVAFKAAAIVPVAGRMAQAAA